MPLPGGPRSHDRARTALARPSSPPWPSSPAGRARAWASPRVTATSRSGSGSWRERAAARRWPARPMAERRVRDLHGESVTSRATISGGGWLRLGDGRQALERVRQEGVAVIGSTGCLRPGRPRAAASVGRPAPLSHAAEGFVFANASRRARLLEQAAGAARPRPAPPPPPGRLVQRDRRAAGVAT
jgi:hypothetical protein